MTVDTRTLHGLDDVMEKLRKLPPAISGAGARGPVAQALRAGAVVIQKAAKEGVRRVTQNTEEAGYVSTKTLEKAIVVRRDSNPRRFGGGATERYAVRISKRKYAGRKQQTTAAATGHYLEFGTENQDADPFMTPAYFASRERALSTIVSELNRRIDAAIAKVSKGAV